MMTPDEEYDAREEQRDGYKVKHLRRIADALEALLEQQQPDPEPEPRGPRTYTATELQQRYTTGRNAP